MATRWSAVVAMALACRLYGEAPLAAISSEIVPESQWREARAAISGGVRYLLSKQAKDGSWGNHPAVTALAAMALNGSRDTRDAAAVRKAVLKARDYILKFVQTDGSIWPAGWRDMYPNYTTSIVVCALVELGFPEDRATILKARRFLLDSQLNEDFRVDGKPRPIKREDPYFGGVGYGKSGPDRPDLSNTQWSLEALRISEPLALENAGANAADIEKSRKAWENVQVFLTRLQHLPETNKAVWVKGGPNDPDRGSFIYKADESKVVGEKGEKTLRGYGSMTYAGLKSMIYAKLKRDDIRVKAALEWAAKNYSAKENPGMGANGYYYYLLTMAKALSAYGDSVLNGPGGKKIHWRQDIVEALLEARKPDGEWYNEKSGRWWENSPELVTSYALLTLEVALSPTLPPREKNLSAKLDQP